MKLAQSVLLGRRGFGIATLARSASGLLVVPILIAYLPSDQYGLVVLLMGYWWIAQAVISLGVSEGITRAAVDAPVEVARTASLMLILPLGVVSAVFMLAAYLNPDLVVGVPWSPAVAVGLAIACLQSLFACQLANLRARDSIDAATLALWTFAILPPLAGVGVVLSLSSTAAGYLSGYLCALVLVTALTSALAIRGPGADHWLTSFSMLKDAAATGLLLFPQSAALLAVDLGTRRLILHVSDVAALGVYGAAFALGSLGWNLQKALSQTWVPDVYRAVDDSVNPLAGKIARRWTLVGLGSVACVAMVLPFSDIFLPVTYSSRDFTTLALLVSASALVGPSFVVMTSVLARARESRMVTSSAAIMVGISALLIIPLAIRIDWQFAAVGLFCVLSIGVLVMRWLGVKASIVPPELPFRVIAAGIGLLVVAAVASIRSDVFAFAGPLLAVVGLTGVAFALRADREGNRDDVVLG